MRAPSSFQDILGALMFRVAFAAYFLTTTLAGPSLCFCGVARLARAAVGCLSSTAPDANLHPCCCKPPASIGRRVTTAPFGNQSNQSEEQCPCQKHVAKNQCFHASTDRGNLELNVIGFDLPSFDAVTVDSVRQANLFSNRCLDFGADSFPGENRLV